MADTWLSAIGHFVSDVVGTVLGVQVVETRKKVAEAAGVKLKDVLMPDRTHIMQELLALGDDTKELVDLLKRAEDGFIRVGKKRYLENWIINMLLKIEPKYRQPVFLQLNEVLETKGEAEFFTYLEILHNDGWAQYLKLFWIQISEAIIKVREKLPKERVAEALKNSATATDQWAANKAAPAIERFNDWLDSKGVR